MINTQGIELTTLMGYKNKEFVERTPETDKVTLNKGT